MMHLAALIACISLFPSLAAAQASDTVDHFSVRGAVEVRILSTSGANVVVQADSGSKSVRASLRALDVDEWTAPASRAVAEGKSTFRLAGQGPQGESQTVQLVSEPRVLGSPLLRIEHSPTARVSVLLGPILATRFVEAMERGATVAHEMFAGLGRNATDAPSCDSLMADVRTRFGNPDHVVNYDAGNYHSVEWSYRGGASSVRFARTEGEVGCHVSVFNSQ
jgi:hypothetical protein